MRIFPSGNFCVENYYLVLSGIDKTDTTKKRHQEPLKALQNLIHAGGQARGQATQRQWTIHQQQPTQP